MKGQLHDEYGGLSTTGMKGEQCDGYRKLGGTGIKGKYTISMENWGLHA